MDAEAAVGAQVKMSTAARVRTMCICALLLLCRSSIEFADHYAVIVTGASGGDEYARKYDTWRASLLNTLREKLRFDENHVIVLADHESAGVSIATRENVQRVFTDLRRRLTKDDLLF